MNVDPQEVSDMAKSVVTKADIFITHIWPIVSALNKCDHDDVVRPCFYPETAVVIVTLKTREAFEPLRALSRMWKKTVPSYAGSRENPDLIWYDAVINGIEVQARICELPPSCKVEYIEEQVPAHTRRVAKVTCNNGEMNPV